MSLADDFLPLTESSSRQLINLSRITIVSMLCGVLIFATVLVVLYFRLDVDSMSTKRMVHFSPSLYPVFCVLALINVLGTGLLLKFILSKALLPKAKEHVDVNNQDVPEADQLPQGFVHKMFLLRFLYDAFLGGAVIFAEIVILWAVLSGEIHQLRYVWLNMAYPLLFLGYVIVRFPSGAYFVEQYRRLLDEARM